MRIVLGVLLFLARECNQEAGRCGHAASQYSAATPEVSFADVVPRLLTLHEELFVGHNWLVRMAGPAMLNVGLIIGDTDHQTRNAHAPGFGAKAAPSIPRTSSKPGQALLPPTAAFANSIVHAVSRYRLRPHRSKAVHQMAADNLWRGNDPPARRALDACHI